jgi:hypothetical protein
MLKSTTKNNQQQLKSMKPMPHTINTNTAFEAKNAYNVKSKIWNNFLTVRDRTKR